MHSDSVVWRNGTLMPADDIHLCAHNRGLLVGDGVFETLLARDNMPLHLTRHLKRLRSACTQLGFILRYSNDELALAVDRVLTISPAPKVWPHYARVRITVTAGAGGSGLTRDTITADVMVSAAAYIPDRSPMRVVTLPWQRNASSPVTGIKTTSQIENVAAMRYITQQNADEGIWRSSTGHLSEGTTTNLFVETKGRVVTPPLSSGCLGGIAREVLLEHSSTAGIEIADEPVPAHCLEWVKAGDASLFLTSSLRGIVPVGSLDGTPTVVGPATKHLMTLLNGVIGG